MLASKPPPIRKLEWQFHAIWKVNKFTVRDTLLPKHFQHSTADTRDAGSLCVGEALHPIQYPRKPALPKHPQSNRGIRLQVLDMKHKGYPLYHACKPCRNTQQQRRRKKKKKIRPAKGQDA